MLQVRPLSLPDVLEIVPRKFSDSRGFFCETFNRERLQEIGVRADWMQDNHSYSAERFTLRGLHYQEPPFAQHKLVRVLRGSVFDVAVDIRKGSPTFGRWTGIEVSAESLNQIFVPIGFAHGFLTLEPDTEVFYKVSAPYSSRHDRSVRWDDPQTGIDWPVSRERPVLSDKDRDAPSLAEIDVPFKFGS